MLTNYLPCDQEVVKNWRKLQKKWPETLASRVHISDEALNKYVLWLKLQGKKIEHWTIPGLYPASDTAFARWVIVTGAINFAYWLPEFPKKFEVENPGGKNFSGAFAMDRCFLRAFGELPITAELLEPHFENLETARKFFCGVTDIPFLEWRFWNIRELIDVLKTKFAGDPINIYEEAGWDAARLVTLLVHRFPTSFGGDVSVMNTYFPPLDEAYIFRFYKLAKLAPVLYQGRAKKEGSTLKELSNIGQIAAIADYEIPKAKRHQGVLVYNSKLAAKVDSGAVIHRHSLDEIAIRAADTVTNYEILERLNEGLFLDHPAYWTILPLDLIEWISGRDSKQPHHRTPTSAY
ncbi:MAG: queuosine salvage family protein [bacterium]|nr:queuosine salvage family protein [bacterium]